MILLDKNPNGLGRIEVKTLSLPGSIKVITATYTASGTVLAVYRKDGDSTDPDFQNIAVLNDDGTGFRNIFSGVIKQHPKANGIRYMVFADNKRVLLGDWVLECSPEIDSCEKAKLVPLEYPVELVDDPATMKHWSEIIIAPDNEHISWTMLRSDGSGAAAFIGKLVRHEKKYTVEKTQIINSLAYMKEDSVKPGFFVPQVTRGGEVKQFVRGGTAISLVGFKDSRLTDSVVQDLCSEEIQRITNTPGYDETTIFSPDGKLGLVMSSRASPKTNPAVFGLMPRPPYVLQRIILSLYMYAVAGVRKFRKGNIGPILIDIKRSMIDKNYLGVSLNDPEEAWVYYSPMSWHPSSKKTMWLEGLRGTKTMRIRIAELQDYMPGLAVPTGKTPDNIPYGEKDLSKVRSAGTGDFTGKIAGKHTGYIELIIKRQKGLESLTGSAEAVYVNYSDDGKTFYNGFEKSRYSPSFENTYEADVVMSGAEAGETKFRAAFAKTTDGELPKLLFDKDEDGKPKSCGYARYQGVTLKIEDLLA
jgi:hypothetical protein